MNTFDTIYNNILESLYDDLTPQEWEEMSACYTTEDDEEIPFEQGVEGISDDEWEHLEEAIKRKRVVRKGKRIIKYISTKAGYRVQKTGPNTRKEVRITPKELLTRKRAAKKTARKSVGKRRGAVRKRRLSNRKRKGI